MRWDSVTEIENNSTMKLFIEEIYNRRKLVIFKVLCVFIHLCWRINWSLNDVAHYFNVDFLHVFFEVHCRLAKAVYSPTSTLAQQNAYISMTICKQTRVMDAPDWSLELKVCVINMMARDAVVVAGRSFKALEKQSAWPIHAYSTAKYLQAFLIMIISSEGWGFWRFFSAVCS